MSGKRVLVLGALSTCLLAAGCSSGTPTVSQTDVETQVKEALADKKVLLAEKIETTEAFQEAKRMGFQLFKGYFFCKPNIVPYGIGSKKSSHVVYARIMEELKKEDFLYGKISDISETDVDLSYRLFKILENKK